MPNVQIARLLSLVILIATAGSATSAQQRQDKNSARSFTPLSSRSGSSSPLLLVQSGAARQAKPQQTPDQTAPAQAQKKTPSAKQTKRMFWVVPNFAAVDSDTQLPPLSPKDKFLLATEDSFDYSSFVWAGILTAQSLALNSDPELGHGVRGYGRYYWRTFTDGVSGTFFTEAIIPTITHEDPRYYTMGHGGFFRRAGYALSRSVVTKTDSGHLTFNWSEVGGNAFEAALSNAYYPAQERGASQTARNWATQMESAALNNIAKEFWPDIRRKIFRRK